MTCEIITIGDELLIGMTVDTNSGWMATELTSLGAEIYQITTISDEKGHILKSIDEAMNRSDLVLVTGGLGPTSDDITKPALAEYFETELIFNEEVFSSVKELLRKRDLTLNENNRRQAEVPACCKILPNRMGTAPGMWFEKEGHVLVSMPGVPYEMRDIMINQVIPNVKDHFNLDFISFRLVMTYGTFEARLAELLTVFESQLPDNIKLAYLPTSGIIKLRLTGKGKDQSVVRKELDRQVEKLEAIVPQYIYGYDGETLEQATGRLLKAKSMTISTAESCTGGNIAHMITSVPGSSSWFTGSVVAYDNRIKISELSVTEEDIASYGAVSENIVKQMASGIRKKYGTDWGVATSGIAGPDGGTVDKPVGTVWIAVASEKSVITRKYTFGDHREINIRRASLAALNMLREQITG
ncbi:MAG TPA: competence/damage-inducible protein A [Bacteroidales bacterium]|nr:competence/damage-inducible protein A [Bacteroidales bacterium]